jgi:hypothetical protein
MVWLPLAGKVPSTRRGMGSLTAGICLAARSCSSIVLRAVMVSCRGPMAMVRGARVIRAVGSVWS